MVEDVLEYDFCAHLQSKYVVLARQTPYYNARLRCDVLVWHWVGPIPPRWRVSVKIQFTWIQCRILLPHSGIAPVRVLGDIRGSWGTFDMDDIWVPFQMNIHSTTSYAKTLASTYIYAILYILSEANIPKLYLFGKIYAKRRPRVCLTYYHPVKGSKEVRCYTGTINQLHCEWMMWIRSFRLLVPTATCRFEFRTEVCNCSIIVPNETVCVWWLWTGLLTPISCLLCDWTHRLTNSQTHRLTDSHPWWSQTIAALRYSSTPYIE